MWTEFFWDVKLGDNYSKYSFGEVYLRIYPQKFNFEVSRAVKRDFQPYIQLYTSPNENFEYGYPHSNAYLQFRLKLEACKPHVIQNIDVIIDVKQFPTVYTVPDF